MRGREPGGGHTVVLLPIMPCANPTWRTSLEALYGFSASVYFSAELSNNRVPGQHFDFEVLFIKPSLKFDVSFFVKLIPLWYIKLQTDKRMPSATTRFISPVVTRYMLRSYWPSSGIKYMTIKAQNKLHICRMFSVGYILFYFQYILCILIYFQCIYILHWILCTMHVFMSEDGQYCRNM
jgi:hypothetical protein